jgi:hypothetical protein
LWNPFLPGRLEDHLEKPHHLVIPHPLRHFLEQQRVLHVVEGNHDTLPIISTFPKT